MRSKLAAESYITRRQKCLQKKSIVSTIHAMGNLASLLITPADRSKIGLVVHEAAVEVRLDIRVGRCDVDLLSSCREIATMQMVFTYFSTTSRVFLEAGR